MSGPTLQTSVKARVPVNSCFKEDTDNLRSNLRSPSVKKIETNRCLQTEKWVKR